MKTYNIISPTLKGERQPHPPPDKNTTPEQPRKKGGPKRIYTDEQRAERSRQSWRRWQRNNPEQEVQRQKRKYHATHEKVRKVQQVYRRDHKEDIAEYQRLYSAGDWQALEERKRTRRLQREAKKTIVLRRHPALSSSSDYFRGSCNSRKRK